jgi:hypothetical protein
MPADFPYDENGAALRRLQTDGDDLTQERSIDFTVVFPSEQAAERFAKHFRQLGCEVSCKDTHCVAELPWDVVVAKQMVPSHAAITEFENELQQMASILGGRNDGWGCFAQKD